MAEELDALLKKRSEKLDSAVFLRLFVGPWCQVNSAEKRRGLVGPHRSTRPKRDLSENALTIGKTYEEERIVKSKDDC